VRYSRRVATLATAVRKHFLDRLATFFDVLRPFAVGVQPPRLQYNASAPVTKSNARAANVTFDATLDGADGKFCDGAASVRLV
jgi:hypothetical protein